MCVVSDPNVAWKQCYASIYLLFFVFFETYLLCSFKLRCHHLYILVPANFNSTFVDWTIINTIRSPATGDSLKLIVH